MPGVQRARTLRVSQVRLAPAKKAGEFSHTRVPKARDLAYGHGPRGARARAGSCHTAGSWMTQTWRARAWILLAPHVAPVTTGAYNVQQKTWILVSSGRSKKGYLIHPAATLGVRTLCCCGYPRTDLTPWQGTNTARVFPGISQHSQHLPQALPSSVMEPASLRGCSTVHSQPWAGLSSTLIAA